ncbi:uncharacterized protein [Epargyreus clarus]|uniref:uncharacterized protein n=1 Tax=Epargyreus clarus TaxID=520877 RepID=UPI003C3068D3
MSVIIRLQNLPWSANALDIRNFFRGLSIPEGGVHIVGGELGDAFIAFSTDEDARQGMMLNGGKIKEIQVKLLLSSRSEMHKVIEAARQSVPILTLTAAASPAPAAPPAPPVISQPTPAPAITPFSAALGTNPLSSFSIPGIGNPQEIPQPAVIEIPAPLSSPTQITVNLDEEKDDDKPDKVRKQDKDRRRTRSRSRSRDRERKDRKRDRRDRSRSRERRRRDRSRSRERRDRKRDRKDRSRSRERSPRRSRDKRDRKSPLNVSQDRSLDGVSDISGPMLSKFPNKMPGHLTQSQGPMQPGGMQNGPTGIMRENESRFSDPALADTFNKLQELGKKRNPNAFQGDQNGGRFSSIRGGGNPPRGGGSFRRENRPSRFDDQQHDCCVAIRNAPNHTSYGDVRRFFPFMIDKHGIKMINDNMGRRTGNIFVRFCDTRSKQLALHMKVNELKGAPVNVEHLDDEAYESAVDSFLPFREDNDDEDPSLVIAETEENNAQPAFNIIKLSDLPTFVKEHDIIKTFSEFSLLSITLKDCRNTRSKVAFVQFVKPEDAKIVLESKDRYLFGRRQPTITIATSEEYENEKLTVMGKDTDPSNGMGQSQDLPGPRDPRQRRQPIDQGSPQMIPPQGGSAMQGGPQIQGGPPMQPQGPPFFPNPQFPVQPQNFGTPYPSPQFGAFPSRPGMPHMPRAGANNWPNRPPFPNQGEQIPGGPLAKPHVLSVDMENETLDCILMKGLPRGTNDRSIVTFLSDTGAVPARIHIMLDANGTPSGECFCEFRSTQEALQAVAKHGQNLEDSRLTIELVSKRVVEEALEGPKQADVKRESLLGNGPAMFFEAPRGGFPPRGPYRGRGGFDRGGFERGGFNRGGFDQLRGGFDQGRGGYDHGRGDFNQGRGGFRGRGGWNERGGRGFERGRGRGFGRGRGGVAFENGREREPRADEEDPALEDFGAPGCVVSMENVPFRATIDDILAFFSEFELSQDDVIRRYNERGQPTGDARVAFRAAFDAQRAVQTCHLNMIHDRRIHLNVL